jgi:two-component system nitrate/nitrite response regulator NarL
LLREGLRRILSAADFCIIAAAASVDDVMPSVLTETRLILLILDVSGDQNATVTQVRLFRERHPTSRIVLLADHDQLADVNILAAFRSGADAYFLKPSCDTFIKSLELVLLGETILPPAILSCFLRQEVKTIANESETTAGAQIAGVQRDSTEYNAVLDAYDPRLSAREQSILQGLIQGESNKIIARKMDIAEATVKVHVKAILRKIRVHNRTQAAIWALNHDSLLSGMSNSPLTGSARVTEFFLSSK